jgi:hypothetical protein
MLYALEKFEGASLNICNQKKKRSVAQIGRRYPSPGGVAQLVERVLYHSTRRAVPERSWVQSLLPTTEVEPGFSTFGGMLVPVLQLISPVCKTGTSRRSVAGRYLGNQVSILNDSGVLFLNPGNAGRRTLISTLIYV